MYEIVKEIVKFKILFKRKKPKITLCLNHILLSEIKAIHHLWKKVSKL